MSKASKQSSVVSEPVRQMSDQDLAAVRMIVADVVSAQLQPIATLLTTLNSMLIERQSRPRPSTFRSLSDPPNG